MIATSSLTAVLPGGSLASKKLEIPAELLVFAKGGHGFGVMQRGQPIDAWPARVAEWLASMGLATITSE